MKMNVLKQLCLATGLLFFGAAQASAPSSSVGLSVWIQNNTDGILELRRPGELCIEILSGDTQEFPLENLQNTTVWAACPEGFKKKIVTTIGWQSGRIFIVKAGSPARSGVGCAYDVWSKIYKNLLEPEEHEPEEYAFREHAGSSNIEPAPFFNNMSSNPIYFLTALGVVPVPSHTGINFYTGELTSYASYSEGMRKCLALQHDHFKKIVEEEVEYPAEGRKVSVAPQQEE